jgi:small-conductance mechanosensitive channel
MIDLFEISNSYTFRLINLILLVVICFSYYYGKKLITKKVGGTVSDKGIVIKGKEYSYKKLIDQLMIIIGLFLVYSAIGYGNDKFSLSTLLSFELISRNRSSGTGFHLTLGQVVGVGVLFFITKMTINLIRLILFKAFKDKEWIDDARRHTIVQMSRYVIYTVCLIVVLKILFGDISNILLASSALFVGLGLGLKEFFTDVVSGFILLNDGSIKVGDIVELQGSIARVERISIRTSHVRTTEGKTIIVPNSRFTEENLTNWSISAKVTRFHIDVSVAYGTDTQLVKELLYNVALNHPSVDKKNNIIVMFDDFGDSGLKFQLYFWAQRTWDIMVIKSDIRFEVDKVFRENKVTIPFPQRDLHIVSDRTKKDTARTPS